MKKFVSIVVISVLFIIHQSLAAQENYVANKLFYTELGGAGVIMSANFDGRFIAQSRLGLGYRIGAGFGVGRFDRGDDYGVRRTYYTIPVGLNYVLGKPNKSSTFEVGGTVTYLTRKVSLYNYDVYKLGNFIGMLSFMYRMMPVDGGFTFRAGFTPIIGTAGDLYPMVAVGFGYAF